MVQSDLRKRYGNFVPVESSPAIVFQKTDRIVPELPETTSNKSRNLSTFRDVYRNMLLQKDLDLINQKAYTAKTWTKYVVI